MSLQITQMLCPSSKYPIKCPYSMHPTRIVVHNTDNDASAMNEISYMISNDHECSFHYAVDDTRAVQGIPENRNAWHAGDGHGPGNMQGIAIEICYSKSGGQRFDKAEKNAVELIVSLLRKYGWGIDKVTKHQDYMDKHCPDRTLNYGWQRFLSMVSTRLNETYREQLPALAPAGSAFTSDTTMPVTIQPGGTYICKITCSAGRPSLVAGSGGVVDISYQSHTSSQYFFKITADHHGNKETGVFINHEKKPTFVSRVGSACTSDTTVDVPTAVGKCYTVGLTSKVKPRLTIGTDSVATPAGVYPAGSDKWLAPIVAVKSGSTGIYTQVPGEHPVKQFVLKVTA